MKVHCGERGFSLVYTHRVRVGVEYMLPVVNQKPHQTP